VPDLNGPPDRHAPRALLGLTAPQLGDSEPDEIELDCCTAEWSGGRWRHERSCMARNQP
jgi:hypothetical protein